MANTEHKCPLCEKGIVEVDDIGLATCNQCSLYMEHNDHEQLNLLIEKAGE